MQRPRPGSVVQWRPHGLNLAVKRNEQPAPVGADIGGGALEDAQVALLIEQAENAAADQPKQ